MKKIQLKRTITLFQILLIAMFFNPIAAQTGLPQPHEPCFEQGEVLRYLEFALSHSSEHKQAYWVAYTLDSAELEIPMKRINPFKSDPHAAGNKATLSDYSKSGYDRGHLSRAMYNKRNERAYRESYYLSNISPQIGKGFNQTGGLWYKAEDLEMELAKQHKVIYAISGPVFFDNIGQIGNNAVTVSWFFLQSYFIPR
jgi:endonuclease G, mitochondrial